MRNLIDDQAFRVEQESISKQREPLVRAHATNDEIRDLRNMLEQLKAPLSDLAATWHQIPPSLRARFQLYLLPVGFKQGKIGTAELGPVFNLSSDFGNNDSTGVPLIRRTWNRLLRDIQGLVEFFTTLEEAKKELSEPGSKSIP